MNGNAIEGTLATILERVDNLREVLNERWSKVEDHDERLNTIEMELRLESERRSKLAEEVGALRSRLWWVLTLLAGGVVGFGFKLLEHWLTR